MNDIDALETQNRYLEDELRKQRKTLRDEFAMAALPAMAQRFNAWSEIAEKAYNLADQMLNAREKTL